MIANIYARYGSDIEECAAGACGNSDNSVIGWLVVAAVGVIVLLDRAKAK